MGEWNCDDQYHVTFIYLIIFIETLAKWRLCYWYRCLSPELPHSPSPDPSRRPHSPVPRPNPSAALPLKRGKRKGSSHKHDTYNLGSLARKLKLSKPHYEFDHGVCGRMSIVVKLKGRLLNRRSSLFSSIKDNCIRPSRPLPPITVASLLPPLQDNNRNYIRVHTRMRTHLQDTERVSE